MNKTNIEDFIRAQFELNLTQERKINGLYAALKKHKKALEDITLFVNSLKILITDQEYRLTEVQTYLYEDKFYEEPPKLPLIE